MIRWHSMLAGAVTFVAAHGVETLTWRTWFHGAYAPWFLNSGRAVAFTAALLLIAAAVVSADDRRESLLRGGNVGAGAMAAMLVVLAAGVGGNLFPIVAATGALVVAVSTGVGAVAGWALRRGLKG